VYVVLEWVPVERERARGKRISTSPVERGREGLRLCESGDADRIVGLR